jgi:hypothetical protein
VGFHFGEAFPGTRSAGDNRALTHIVAR